MKNYKPQYSFDRQPYAPYQMSNNLANIKRIKTRIKELEAKATAAQEDDYKDQELNGLIVRRHYEADRLQLLFDDVPPPEVRAILKSHGFRWSPRFGAWQRKLTVNAVSVWQEDILPKPEMAIFGESAKKT